MKTLRTERAGTNSSAVASPLPREPLWRCRTHRSGSPAFASVALIVALVGGLSACDSRNDVAATTAPAQIAQAAPEQEAAALKVYRGLRASEVIGMSVRNPEGNNIGQINDMIVDINTGEVQYAVLAFDPGILQGEKLYAVPTTELRMAPDRNDIVYNMSREQLERVGVDRADLPTRLRDQEFFTNLDRLWGRTQPTLTANAVRASTLIGKNVKSRAGEGVGEIEELIIDMANQRVHYVVVQFDTGWTTTGQNYAFPIRSFALGGANQQDLLLDIDRSLLQSMKGFGDDRYGQLNDPAWVADVDRALVAIGPVAGKGTNVGSIASARDGGSTGTAGVGRHGADVVSQARAPRSDRN